MPEEATSEPPETGSRPLVLYHVEERVAVVTLNRPEKRNALSRELWRELDAALIRADEDPAVRIVVLAGAGQAFCAGADIAGNEDPTELLPWLEAFRKHHRRQFRLWDSSKLIIAAVHGYALGRGLEIALWCDLVIASADARLGQPEVREGWVLHSVVPWLIGPQQAKLFMLSGDILDAAAAHRLGLVTKVVEAGAALREALREAKRLAHVPPLAAPAVKRMVNGVYEQQGFRAEQASGIGVQAVTSALPAEAKGVTELLRIRREEGFKASIRYRDAPFES